ncbi:MAG: aldehyde dehydrogenase family protein [Hyphomicrobiaceae bacterium]
MQNELFGPVLCVLRIKSEEQAIEMANATRYAFAAGVFTRDIARAVRLARGIRAGRVWVNSYLHDVDLCAVRRLQRKRLRA